MANRSGVEVNGTDEILQKIELLGLNVKKVTAQALKNGAEIVVEELEKQSPYDSEGNIHMKEHVVMSSVKTDKETDAKYITVGYPKGIKHRVHVVEFGTINQSPQHFMKDTIEITKDKVKDEIMKTLKGALK
ncbi:HK97-gp10 family putative phage morphogenesis protein [Macrococcus carouselicus]|uniref:HK97 gp10 family phage protein n=1 Tax=Macrococcus carouselicus TaxID=69969 RepID=A0A9Q8CNV7_9STAP|nr:HK97-gp10 family putative phage morphogenesis protein [Macrococcus carouselicus]TDM04065.1 HK97 gp10 family phage protein [Macrococcus carouselicus]